MLHSYHGEFGYEYRFNTWFGLEGQAGILFGCISDDVFTWDRMTVDKTISTNADAFTLSLNPHLYFPIVKEGFEIYAAPRTGISFSSVSETIDDYNTNPEIYEHDSKTKAHLFKGMNIGMELWIRGQFIFLADAGWNRINFGAVAETLELEQNPYKNSKNKSDNLTLAIGMKFILKKATKNKFNENYLDQMN